MILDVSYDTFLQINSISLSQYINYELLSSSSFLCFRRTTSVIQPHISSLASLRLASTLHAFLALYCLLLLLLLSLEVMLFHEKILSLVDSHGLEFVLNK